MIAFKIIGIIIIWIGAGLILYPSMLAYIQSLSDGYANWNGKWNSFSDASGYGLGMAAIMILAFGITTLFIWGDKLKLYVG